MLQLKVSSPRIMFYDVMRWSGKGLRLGVMVLLMVGLGFLVATGWQKLFVENDEFLIQEVQLKTAEGEDPILVTHARMVDRTGLDSGSTIFSVDTEQLAVDLERLPEVVSAKVSRRLPGVLKVEIEERLPVAWVACRSLGIRERDRFRGMLVDRAGMLFRCDSDELWEYGNQLPVILAREVEGHELEEGKEMGHEGLQAALKVVLRSGEALEGLERPAWVVVKDDILLEMKTLDGVLATMSYYGVDEQLERLSKVYQHSGDRVVERVNLIPGKFVPVVYR